MSASIEQRNQAASCWVGNLDDKVNEELLWELMSQCGPVVGVHMPRDKVSGKHQGYGFVYFRNELDADYCMKVMNMVKVFNKSIKLNYTSQDKKISDIGANVFIGNLEPDVDEKLLYDTFSAFGGMLSTPKIMRDPETGQSKGYGFISFDSFESSDMAIECMNGQYLSNRAIVVQYAFKKDTPGERHGSQAERLLAASNPSKFKPNTYFSGGVGDTVVQIATPAAPLSATAYGLADPYSSQFYPPPPPLPAVMAAYGYSAPPPPQHQPPPPPLPTSYSNASMYMPPPPPPHM